MSWIQKLYETYENCQSMIGYLPVESEQPLLPICHMIQNIEIEVHISGNGEFINAIVVPREDGKTIIPCTEGSGGRSGRKPECHPLCDKLQYVSGDFMQFGGVVTDGFRKDPQEPHRNYISLLTNWCESEFAHQKAKSVLEYVNKQKLVRDLLVHKILFVGEDGKLLSKWEKKRGEESPDIFKAIGTQKSQSEAFVRWQVVVPGELETKVWRDRSLWNSWIEYYSTTKQKKALCYVMGTELFSADQHPKYIRRPGDGAKLISSNDTDGFTFRGRFTDKYGEQAVEIAFEVTQKAHNALRWLISRQGYRRDEQAIVAWATSGKDIPKPLADPLTILGFNELPSDEASSVYTAENIAIRFKKRIAGYSSELGKTDGVVVMALDSATPGRMAITFYRELTGSEYLERIDRWHDTCTWIHRYRFIEVQEKGKSKIKPIPFNGAPAPSDIAEAAYATNNNGKFQLDDKLRKVTVERLLPCIIDGQPIPRDIVESAVRRASNRVALEDWQWEKTLSIACALFKKLKEKKENYSMALDPTRNTRDYLYGRLLAIADRIEGRALGLSKEKRDTNAARYMQQFAVRPYKTWMQIELALAPYLARLGGRAKDLKNLLDEVMCMFDPIGEFKNDKPLSGEFLLGYHCQRENLKPKGKGVIDEQDEEPVEQEEIE